MPVTLTPARTLALGVQHVLALFAGTVAVPLLVAGALKMSAAESGFLVSAALVAGGVATFIQVRGIGPVGSRLPFVCGTDFTFVSPAIVVGKTYGFSGILGGAIVGSLVEVAIALSFRFLRRLMPPLVSGTVVILIGLTLIPVAVDWTGGGAGTADYGAPRHLALAGFVLVAILAIHSRARGFLSSVAVLAGIALGYATSIAFGLVDFHAVGEARWFAVPWPLTYRPTFSLAASLPFVIAYAVTAVQTAGQVFALADICGEEATDRKVVGGMLADGVASGVAGFLNAMPNNAFSQNMGLVKLSGVPDRSVALAAGGICVLLGLCPKLGAVVAVMPRPVLGGAGLVMFGLVAVTGFEMVRRVPMTTRNMLILAVSLAAGVAVSARPGIIAKLPRAWEPVLGSGITVGALAAFLLNALLPEREDEGESGLEVA